MVEVGEVEDERCKRRRRIQFLKRLRHDCFQSAKIVFENLVLFRRLYFVVIFFQFVSWTL